MKNADVVASQDSVKQETQTVVIEKLIYGGDGLARPEAGPILFVPYSVPGETLAVVPEAGKKSKQKTAHIQSIVTASPDRVDAPCSVFGQCGGCQWQHLSREAQLEWKRKIVAESLERLGGITTEVLPPLTTEEAFAYRNHIQLTVDKDTGGLGYFEPGSHQVVSLAICHLVSPELNTLIQWLAGQSLHTLRIERVVLRVNDAREILLGLEASHADPARLQQLVKLLEEKWPVAGFTLQGAMWKSKGPAVTLQGKPYLRYKIPFLEGQTPKTLTYRVSYESFFQVNTSAVPLMLGQLRQWMVDHITASGGGRKFIEDSPESKKDFLIPLILDLYAGVGTFTLPLSGLAKEIISVESAASSLEDARTMLNLNPDTKNIKIQGGRAEVLLKALKGTASVGINNKVTSRRPDWAVIDPPRKGADPLVLDWMGSNTKTGIIYISCDPTTLARDLKLLCEQAPDQDGKRWQVQAIQPIDLFPQTYHVETMVLLKRG